MIIVRIGDYIVAGIKEKFMELLGITVTDDEFNALMCAQNNGKELKVIDGNVVAVERVLSEKFLRETRISELKQFLADTDYKTIKYVEGEISDEEYEPVLAERKAWRKEINELEEKYAADSE